MCGIVGYNGKDLADPTILSILFLENDSRGGHSTGYYNGKNFVKCIGDSSGIYKELQKEQAKILIGHTRYATHGEHTLENQHPFQYGKVIGCHNGVLSNYKEVGKKYKCKETVVDSQMIFKVINHMGNKRLLGKFAGKLATLFQEGKQFYAYRRENPLYVGRDERGNAYFSSLKTPLEYCGLIEIYQLEQNYIYEYENGQVINKIKVKHKPIKSNNYVNTDWRSYGGYGYNFYGNNRKKKKSRVSGITDAVSTGQIKLLDTPTTTDTFYDDCEEVENWNDSFSFDDSDVSTLEQMKIKLDDIYHRYGYDMMATDSHSISEMIEDLKLIIEKQEQTI